MKASDLIASTCCGVVGDRSKFVTLVRDLERTNQHNLELIEGMEIEIIYLRRQLLEAEAKLTTKGE